MRERAAGPRPASSSRRPVRAVACADRPSQPDEIEAKDTAAAALRCEEDAGGLALIFSLANADPKPV